MYSLLMIRCYKIWVWELVVRHWDSLSLACSKVPGRIWLSYSRARIPLCLPWILLCGYFILAYTLLFWMPQTIVILLLKHGIHEYIFVLYLYSWFSRRLNKDIKSYISCMQTFSWGSLREIWRSVFKKRENVDLLCEIFVFLSFLIRSWKF